MTTKQQVTKLVETIKEFESFKKSKFTQHLAHAFLLDMDYSPPGKYSGKVIEYFNNVLNILKQQRKSYTALLRSEQDLKALHTEASKLKKIVKYIDSQRKIKKSHSTALKELNSLFRIQKSRKSTIKQLNQNILKEKITTLGQANNLKAFLAFLINNASKIKKLPAEYKNDFINQMNYSFADHMNDTIEITLVDGSRQYFTITRRSIDCLINAIFNCNGISFEQVDSDKFILNFQSNNGLTVESFRIIKRATGQTVGALFKDIITYVNPNIMNLNLRKQQIYTAEDFLEYTLIPETLDYVKWPLNGSAEDMNENCFAYSIFIELMNTGNTNPNIRTAATNIIRQIILTKNENCDLQLCSNFKKVMQSPLMVRYKIKLSVYAVNTGKIEDKIYGNGSIILNIGLFNEHYFSNSNIDGFNLSFYLFMSKNPNADHITRFNMERIFKELKGDAIKYRRESLGKVTPLDILTSKYAKYIYTTTKLDVKNPVHRSFMTETNMNISTLSAIDVDETIISQPTIQTIRDMKNIIYANKRIVDSEWKKLVDKSVPLGKLIINTRIAFADTETRVVKKIVLNKIVKQNIIYQVSIKLATLDINGDKVNPNYTFETFVYTGTDAAKQMLTYLAEHKVTRCYFHNLKFDVIQFLKEGMASFVKEPKVIQKDANLYSIKIGPIEYVDSYKMIAMKLADFPACFGLENIKKEWMPYESFANLQIATDGINFEPLFYMGELADEIKNTAIENNCYDLTTNKLDLIKWSEFYCKRDVEVLAAGFIKFNDTLMNKIGMSAFQHLTISSLADKYLYACGVFRGVNKISGICQQFISKTIKGGVCATAYDEKWHVEEKVVDLDATSLYPSAMVEMKGYPLGASHFIENINYNDFRATVDIEQTSLFVEVKFKKVQNENPFRYVPINSKKIDGRISYECKADTSYFLNNIDLEELIKFGCVLSEDITIITGYYFIGYNNTVRRVMSELFNIRSAMKQDKNKCETVIKLLMNSAYGKTCLKPSKENIKLILESKLMNMIKKGKLFKHATSYGINKNGENIYMLYSGNNTIAHENYAHCGSLVLSQSKRIMNRAHNVLDIIIPEPFKASCFYRDTDSLHILEAFYNEFQTKYIEIYGSDPIGNNLGQFKVDYKVPDICNGKNIKSYASNSIWVGRKAWMSVIEYLDTTKKEVVTTLNHCRLKGIPEGVLNSAKDKDDVLVDKKLDIYTKLYNGEKINFDLCGNGDRIRVNFNKGSSIMVDSFNRSIGFE